MAKEINYDSYNKVLGHYDHEITYSYSIIPWGVYKDAPSVKNHGMQLVLDLAEVVNPPWLVVTRESLLANGSLFPDGQVILEQQYGKGDCGALSMFPIHWDGVPEALPSLSKIFGANGEIKQANTEDANTLVVASMLISPSAAAQDGVYPNHVTQHLIQYAKDYAKKHGLKYLIWSVPTGVNVADIHGDKASEAYASYVLSKTCIHPARGFWGYANATIQRLHFEHMLPLAGDYHAIQHVIDIDTFDWHKQTYKANTFSSKVWIEQKTGVWTCGGFGYWEVQGDKAIYIEPHVWLGMSIA